jgi:hypothetical protein
MGVSTGVGDGDTLRAAKGWGLWDLWGGLISPISHIGPMGSRSPDCGPDAAMLIDDLLLLDSSS